MSGNRGRDADVSGCGSGDFDVLMCRVGESPPLGPKVYNVFLIYYLNILIIVLV